MMGQVSRRIRILFFICGAVCEGEVWGTRVPMIADLIIMINCIMGCGSIRSIDWMMMNVGYKQRFIYRFCVLHISDGHTPWLTAWYVPSWVGLNRFII